MNEILIRAAGTSTTWDAETRTALAVLSTGAPVTRADARGEFDEVLDLGQKWPKTVPLLDSHDRSGLGKRLGTVKNIRTEGDEVVGQIHLSRSNAEAKRVAEDLSDGHPFAVSVGYRVERWREQRDPADGSRTRTASKWRLVEASLVAVPADEFASIRSQETDMEDETTTATAPTAERGDEVSTRAETNATIRSIAELAGLDREWTDAQIDAEASAEEARAAAFEAMKSRKQPAIRSQRASIGADFTDPEFRARTIGEALYARTAPEHTPSEAARQYVGMTTLDIARDCLRNASVHASGLSPMKTIERALHSTSDFPLLLGDAVNRTLRASYSAAPSGLKQVARRTTARDFREKHRLQLSEAPRLEKVNEGGEFKSGTLAEGRETYKVATYGRIIGITRQALVNDDLGAFSDLARRMAQAAAATEAQLLADLLLANSGAGPTMADGEFLFSAAHANEETDNTLEAEPVVMSLASARKAMRAQVGLQGELIDVTPKFLVVGPVNETDAEMALAAISPTKADDFNPFAGRLMLVVEPRITSKRWYVVADPSEIDGLEYAYLEGAEGPQTETRAGFEVDGVQIKVSLDFGAGFVEHRSWFTNAGE